MPRLILAVFLCFLQLVSVQATRPVLKIGLTSTTCGNTAGIAINQVQSLRWWANDTNARGGITVNGTVYDVDFVIYNDAIDPELVSILYDRLVNVDQVDLLMGPFGTNLFRAAPYAQQYKIPMMNIGDFTYYSSSNAPNGTFGGWLFSSVPNPLRLVSPCLEILKTKGVSTLASAWTTEVADTSLNLLNFLAAGNAQMAVLSAPANIKTDLSNVDDVIDSLEKFDAPAFSGGMFTATQNAELIDAFIRRKYLPAARIFWVGPAFDAFRTAAGWRGASLLFPDVWNPSLNFTDPEYGNSEGFFNAYKAGTGREPDSTDIMAMHGATAFKLALERANSLDGDAIRIALSELNDEAWMGIANFSGSFQQTTSEYYCFQLNSTGRGIKPVSLNAPTRTRANLVYPAEISIPSGYYPSNSKRKLALGLGLGLGLGVVVLVLLGAFFYWLVVKYQIVFIPKSEDKGEW